MQSIYLDHNATTPLDPRVRAAMELGFREYYGNPSSLHRVGRAARVALDDCRQRLADGLKCKPSELVFTGGGTEGNNLAILGASRALSSKGRHLITSSIEHHSVLNCFESLAHNEGFEVTILPVGRDGLVHPDDLLRSLRPDTTFASFMAANNETGTIQPVAELGSICRDRGVTFHTDASQWVGKLRLESVDALSADLVTICAHKFYGPKGSGLLYIRSGTRIQPAVHGGAQEDERRPGTENVPTILGLAAAMDLVLPEPIFPEETLTRLGNVLSHAVENIPGVQSVAGTSKRLANTLSFTIEGCDNSALIAALDLEGICVSGGSACSTGALVPSHVLLAMGYSVVEARSFIRVSMGRETTDEDIRTLVRVMPGVIQRVRDANIS